jgi:glycerol-3-phosphate dehydrogenase (NAD(P)+)
MKAAVIGDGGWGTALARVLNANGHNVTVWGPFEEYVAQVARTRENSNFLPGVELSPEINWTSDHDTAVRDAELIVLATPTKFYVDVCSAFSGRISPTASVVSVAKGLCAQTHRRMSELAAEILEHPEVAALSGPSHAEEVARNIPTAVVIASRNPQLAQTLQTAFSNPRFRVYTSDDPIGVELGGALKNVIAIAVGASDGLGFGDNTRAALITRGLAEMMRLGVAMGARPETFSGLSGMGDLIVTCTSQLSRNRSVGERIGAGEKVSDILGDMKQATEGVWNCAAARSAARACGIEVPITEQVYAVIHEGQSPAIAVSALMERDVKPESV